MNGRWEGPKDLALICECHWMARHLRLALIPFVNLDIKIYLRIRYFFPTTEKNRVPKVREKGKCVQTLIMVQLGTGKTGRNIRQSLRS